MKIMRKILCSFMMLVMLTPSLVCGSFMIAEKAQAVEMKMPDCHGKAMAKGIDDSKSQDHSGTMLFKDCAEVDLYSAGHTVLKKPDLKITKVFYDSINLTTDYGFELSSYRQIRGPPTETALQPPTYPALYLTTQRLRI